MKTARELGFVILAMSGLARPASAAIAPNPGGSVVVTNATTASASYVATSVSQQVNSYATTISASLGGNSVFSASFFLPFNDPTVQQAVASADAILTGDGASFTAPSLASNTTALQSSVTTTNTPSLSCAQLTSGVYTSTGSATSSLITFGPGTILVGTCLADTFDILAGQTDINVTTTTTYAVPQTVTTTDTYLTSQNYTISGMAGSSGTGSGPTPVGVPEPSTLVLLLAGCGVLFGARRVRA